MPEFIPKDKVQWKNVKVLKSSDEGPSENHIYDYDLILPEPLASWDVWDYWEKERFYSMRDNLSKGEVLFDIGTEQGWCNIIYAQFVGPSNMVLIEPTKEFWPNIKQIWEKNFPNEEPHAFISALLSDKNSFKDVKDPYEWPFESYGDMIDRNKYQYIHENEDQVGEITVDKWVKETGIIPDALTMDVEGAELLVLKGAKGTIKNYKPKIWLSVHPDLGLRDYGVNSEDTIKFLTDLGYKANYLATDHEEHWYFEPVK